MLLLVGSGDIGRFLENGSSLVGAIGGNDSGRVTGQPGCGSITASGLWGDSIVKHFGAVPNRGRISRFGEYLQFFSGNMEYAIFPRARIPVFAMSFGIKNRDLARQWAAGQIRENIMDETCVKEITALGQTVCW